MANNYRKAIESAKEAIEEVNEKAKELEKTLSKSSFLLDEINEKMNNFKIKKYKIPKE